ncbi:MAG: zf-HC2 domain-containing protein [Acidobacteria bacterium]|nr:zf-HC2 domain-containing protein [Acidobacteriota bacterium]
MLLAHPEAEDLARFVEGTLDDPERAAIVQHIADCDDCRILVVDAAEFVEPAKTESHSNWWMGIAAALILVAAGIGGLFVWQRRDPAAGLTAATAGLKSRLVEARLSGFPYREWHVSRGGGTDADAVADPAVLHLEVQAGEVLERTGSDAKTLHAHGLAHLLAASTATEANEIRSERSSAVALLQEAANRAPDNVAYQTDLAAALLTAGDKNSRDLALTHLEKALTIDPRNPEALFNKALALRDSNQALPLRESNPKAAIAAFQRYLAVDPSSPWADEARKKLEDLQEPP